MKHTAYLMAFVALLGLGCQAIMRKAYGVKKPDIENEKSIKKTALKYHLDTTNIIAVQSNALISFLNQHSIPDAAIYDAQGNYIEYKQTDTSCNAGLFEFIPNLDVVNNYNKPAAPTLHEQLVKMRDLKGRTLNPVEPADFYVLIFWTKWSGKLNKDHVKVWEDLAMKNTKSKIKLFKVNLDIQENWDKVQRDKLYKGFRNKK